MSRSLLTLIAAMAASLIGSNQIVAQQIPGDERYGTDPKDLSQMAKSPIRLNMVHPNTIFRVRVDGLMPGTTYYYTVDSTGLDGTSDGVKGTVNQFTTRQVEQSK